MSKAIALDIIKTAANLGWCVEVRGEVLTIRKAGVVDNNALVCADMEYGGILDLLPTTSAGSTWGTDCGGIGALAALKTGVFVMNKSGGSKRVLNALAKML